MPAYNFKLRFADQIRKKKKRQTIRAERKDGRRPRVGQIAYCFIGMRTRFCERLGDFPINEVSGIEINPDAFCQLIITNNVGQNKYFHNPKTMDEFARADGFKNWNEFIEFFRYEHGFPFKGVLIKW